MGSTDDESNSAPEDERSRTEIRSELAGLSFEQLQKLKEELGAKVYKEAMFGVNNKDKRAREQMFKRDNKNRPREMSSKKPVPFLKDTVGSAKVVPRDPRFDRLCGKYDPEAFKSSYSFLGDVRQEELGELKEQLKSTEDEAKKGDIKYLIQRMENQNRESEKRKEEKTRKAKEREERIQRMKEGKQPHFVKKSEKQVVDLVEQYKSLKKSGKLEKHIERKRKKSIHKSRQKMKDIPF